MDEGPICQNGGGCIAQNIWSLYKCVCQPGFSGLQCETKGRLILLEGNIKKKV